MINNKFIFIVHYIKLITLIIFLSVLSFEFTFAQTDAKFERITRSDGLSHDNVYSIIQDKYGFIWFATQDGLNRYDGYGYNIFYNEPNNINSISSSNFGVVFNDSNGYLWLGTYRSGLDRYDPITRQFKHFKYTENDSISISSNKIRAITEDGLGNIWIGTSGGGLNKYNPKTESFTIHSLLSRCCQNSLKRAARLRIAHRHLTVSI